MMTWQLWRALRSPAAQHPLYRRITVNQPVAFRYRRYWLWLLLGLAGLLWFMIGSDIGGEPVFGFIGSVLPFIMLMNNLAGLSWATAISSRIAESREQGTFEVFAMLPMGIFGSGWIIGSATLYRKREFENQIGVVRLVTLLSLVALAALMIYSVYALIAPPEVPKRSLFSSEWYIIETAALIVLFILDSLQTVVLAVLIGLNAATMGRGRADSVLLSTSSFLLAQVGIYLLGVGIGFGLLPALFDDLGWRGWLAQIVLVVLRLAVLCGLREALIVLLWRALLNRFNAAADDIATASAG